MYMTIISDSLAIIEIFRMFAENMNQKTKNASYEKNVDYRNRDSCRTDRIQCFIIQLDGSTGRGSRDSMEQRGKSIPAAL